MHDEIMNNKAYMITIVILMITDLVTIFTLFSDEKENEKVEGEKDAKDATLPKVTGGKARDICKKAKTKRDKREKEKKTDIADDLPPKPDAKNADKPIIDVYDANEPSINTYK
jgi:hypothetical protein